MDAVDLGALSTQIGRFHVVAVHQQFELFLREFRAEHPKSNWDKEEGDDLLKATLKNIGDGYARTAALLGRLEVDVADYYRHVRNRFVHAMEEKARMPVDAKELRGRVGESDEYNRLAAPNAYDAIRFDDFVLFTRVAKNIALQLCKVARPTDRQIFEMLGRTEEKQAVAALIRRLDRKPERLRKALATFLRSRFSLDDHEAEPIIEMITGR